MIVRLLLFGMVAALASATPITFTFDGTADGTLGAISFTQADFTITFTSDTTDIVHPSAIPVDWSTPAGTPATFFISGVGLGVFMDDQAVFVHPDPEDDIGIWHFNGADAIAKNEPAFATYNLQTSIGPIFDGVNGWPDIFPGGAINTNLGSLVLSNITALAFQAQVATTTSATPEPSTAMLLSLGIGGIALGTRFRKRK